MTPSDLTAWQPARLPDLERPLVLLDLETRGLDVAPTPAVLVRQVACCGSQGSASTVERAVRRPCTDPDDRLHEEEKGGYPCRPEASTR
jgi:hypothetical protein